MGFNARCTMATDLGAYRYDPAVRMLSDWPGLIPARLRRASGSGALRWPITPRVLPRCSQKWKSYERRPSVLLRLVLAGCFDKL